MHSLPSDVRSRFPGWGSQCSVPVSSSMVRYALRATPHSRGTSSAAEAASLSPSTHLVVSTRVEQRCGSSAGAVTEPSERASIAAEKAAVASASLR